MSCGETEVGGTVDKSIIGTASGLRPLFPLLGRISSYLDTHLAEVWREDKSRLRRPVVGAVRAHLPETSVPGLSAEPDPGRGVVADRIPEDLCPSEAHRGRDLLRG